MKLKRMTLAATIAAVSLSIIAPAAYAANVLKVDGLTSPAGNVAFAAPLVAGTTIGFLSDFAIPTTCSTSAASGYVKRGVTVAAGAQIGAVTGLTFGGCTMTGLGFPMIIGKKGTTEWGIFATAASTSNAQATIPVEIRNMVAQMRSTGAVPLTCEFEATGSVRGTFNQNTQVLSITPANSTAYSLPIQAYNGAGTNTPQRSGLGICGGQIYTGDRFQMTGSFQLATPGVGGIKLQ